jgi:single-stranded-DNA-specific exonuclease
MTIKESNLARFTERLNDVVKRTVTPDDFVPSINADAEVELKECTYPFFDFLQRIEPFGPGNPRPLFLCRNLTNKYEPRIVGVKHLKMMVAGNGMVMDAVAFNCGHRINDVKNARTFSLAFSLDENEWNGRKTLQMKVKGVDV